MSSTKSIPVITKFWSYGTNLVSPRVFVIIQLIIHSRPNFTVQLDLNQLGYHRWRLLGGFSVKIAIEFDLARLSLAVVGLWPLFRGGRKLRFDFI